MPPSTDLSAFQNHILRCNNATLPGSRTPLYLMESHSPIGWVDKRIVNFLKENSFPEKQCLILDNDKIILQHPEGLFDLGEKLAEKKIYASHFEPFDVFPDIHTPAVARIDRGALPLFGFIGKGVHVNGLVKKGNDLYLWVGKRSLSKRLDPGKMDHLVAGGMAAGHTARQTLLKEAEEEASIPASIAEKAVATSRVSYVLERPEGLRRDILYIYDLILPDNFIPKPNDDEVENFYLMPLLDVMEKVISSDDFKFNVNLVLIDLFFRYGLIDPSNPKAKILQSSLNVL